MEENAFQNVHKKVPICLDLNVVMQKRCDLNSLAYPG